MVPSMFLAFSVSAGPFAIEKCGHGLSKERRWLTAVSEQIQDKASFPRPEPWNAHQIVRPPKALICPSECGHATVIFHCFEIAKEKACCGAFLDQNRPVRASLSCIWTANISSSQWRHSSRLRRQCRHIRPFLLRRNPQNPQRHSHQVAGRWRLFCPRSSTGRQPLLNDESRHE